MAFSDWLLSLSNMHLGFFQVVLWLDRSFLFFFFLGHFFLEMNNMPLFGCTSIYLSTQAIEEYLSCFPVGALRNRAITDILCRLLHGPEFSVHLGQYQRS